MVYNQSFHPYWLLLMLQKEQGKANPAVNPSLYNADLTGLYGM